ncbi:MAG: glycine cleavage system protein GcvH [Candidatus Brocadiaceae bacterium]|nr:glycine cleavage system protein GcvH [Candidatus Brocadiaceae bacterium]
MENPKDLKYIEDHEWVRIDGDTATIGITDYAQKQLTDIVYVELPEVGKQVGQGENLGVVESMKSVSDICSPISGEVIVVNNALEKSPELVNSEPFDGGWIAKLKIKDNSEIESLMTSEDYDKLIE